MTEVPLLPPLTRRSVVVVNLDPAHDELPYHCAVDVRELVNVDDVMQAYELGPNGGMLTEQHCRTCIDTVVCMRAATACW